MANELQHVSVGTSLTQAEYEAVGAHVLNSQATGDLIYASSASQLTRLGIGSTGQFLRVAGGIPSWATTLGAANGGTGVANNAASTITISGSYATTLAVSNTTSVTLPTTGTLATLAGAEEFDNKTLDSSVAKGTWTASGTWTIPGFTLGGDANINGSAMSNVYILMGTTGFDFSIRANSGETQATARNLLLQVLNSTGDAFVTAIQLTPNAANPSVSLVPTGTGTVNIGSATALVSFFGETAAAQQTKAAHNNWAAVSDVVSALVNLGLVDTA